jgi:hypothetical protein
MRWPSAERSRRGRAIRWAGRWRGNDGIVGKGQRLTFTRHGSTDGYQLSINFFVYSKVILTGRVGSNGGGGSYGNGRSWRGG